MKEIQKQTLHLIFDGMYVHMYKMKRLRGHQNFNELLTRDQRRKVSSARWPTIDHPRFANHRPSMVCIA
jgi:hypothetical protein